MMRVLQRKYLFMSGMADNAANNAQHATSAAGSVAWAGLMLGFLDTFCPLDPAVLPGLSFPTQDESSVTACTVPGMMMYTTASLHYLGYRLSENRLSKRAFISWSGRAAGQASVLRVFSCSTALQLRSRWSHCR
eukprot:5820215-Pleurochrysis_carterae.AAC.3